MDRRGRDHHRTDAKRVVNVLMLVVVMFLLVDSVASSSRFLPNFPELAAADSGASTMIPGLGSSRSKGTLSTQRSLLQDYDFTRPILEVITLSMGTVSVYRSRLVLHCSSTFRGRTKDSRSLG